VKFPGRLVGTGGALEMALDAAVLLAGILLAGDAMPLDDATLLAAALLLDGASCPV
jgi:hypothetical protein